VTGGRAASIAWDVYLDERGHLNSWPGIERPGWNAAGFRQVLLEAYKRAIGPDRRSQQTFAQLNLLDAACERVRQATAGDRGVLAIRLTGMANAGAPDGKNEVLLLQSDVMTFLKTGNLDQTEQVSSWVVVEPLEANESRRAGSGSLVCVLA
jgi:hypothetical protein